MPNIYSLIYGLPKDVREELFARFAESQASGYYALEKWLTENGHAVSHSSLHRSLSGFTDIVRHLRRAEFLHCAMRDRMPFESALQHVVLMDIGAALVRLADSKAPRTKRAR